MTRDAENPAWGTRRACEPWGGASEASPSWSLQTTHGKDKIKPGFIVSPELYWETSIASQLTSAAVTSALKSLNVTIAQT